MYVATIPNRGSPPALLLREGYREGRQVKTRTLANLTHWPAARVEALRRCLKGEFDAVGTTSEPVSDRIFAVLFVLKEVAQRLGITSALGTQPLAQLALLLILARVAHQGSRLSAVRWVEEHAVAEVLGITPFDENDLYAALDWLAAHQEKIENQVNSYNDFTISSGLIRISHLGKSGFLSNFFSIARIAFLVSEIPFS